MRRCKHLLRTGDREKIRAVGSAQQVFEKFLARSRGTLRRLRASWCTYTRLSDKLVLVAMIAESGVARIKARVLAQHKTIVARLTDTTE